MQQQDQGLPLHLMLGRAANGYLPNQINSDLILLKNFRVRQAEVDLYAKRKGCTSSYHYREGDKVVMKNVRTKVLDIK